jgi:hypothetical protein
MSNVYFRRFFHPESRLLVQDSVSPHLFSGFSREEWKDGIDAFSDESPDYPPTDCSVDLWYTSHKNLEPNNMTGLMEHEP